MSIQAKNLIRRILTCTHRKTHSSTKPVPFQRLITRLAQVISWTPPRHLRRQSLPQWPPTTTSLLRPGRPTTPTTTISMLFCPRSYASTCRTIMASRTTETPALLTAYCSVSFTPRHSSTSSSPTSSSRTCRYVFHLIILVYIRDFILVDQKI